MPLYIDIHELGEHTAQEVAEAHAKDLEIQDEYGVNYLKYWLNEQGGRIYCLCEAPTAEAAEIVHVKAHGLAAQRIIEIDPGLANGFLGGIDASEMDLALLPGTRERDPGTRTILFTDIVGSTEITQRLGDRAAMSILDIHDRVVRSAIDQHGGREVKHLGDGIMAAFASASAAMECAAAIHADLRQASTEAPVPIELRIGAATGEPVEREGDFFGSTVQLAARLCAHAQPGQILVSSEVTDRCTGARFDHAGEVKLKGFPEPTPVHALITA